MPGYTLDQLKAKNAALGNYVGCLNCRLHWHKRSFEKHFNVTPSASATSRPIAIIHPAWERFINFLVEGAVKQWMKDHGEEYTSHEHVEGVSPTRSRSRANTSNEHETVTVEEAVARYGLSREEIMADFERNMVPFEVELRRPPSRRGQRKREGGPDADAKPRQ